MTGRTSYTAEYGDNVTLLCSADGIPKPNITWSKLNSMSELPSGAVADEGRLQLFSVRSEDSGTYRCQARSVAGNESHNITLNVQGKGLVI